jgi:hypothetical protein
MYGLLEEQIVNIQNSWALHPLPVPDKHFDSVVIDFVRPLPKDDGFDAIVTMTEHLGADVQITACTTDMATEDFTFLFFNKWYCENGCPLEIISDHEKLFVSKFLESAHETHRYQSQTLNSIPPTDGCLIEVIKQNHRTVPTLPCQTEPKRVGKGIAKSKIQHDEHTH